MREDLMKAAHAGLAKALKTPSKTVKLELNNAHLEDFPTGIFECKNLEFLGLFRAIAPKIVRTKKGFEVADLSIPKEIGTLHKLQTLEMGGLTMRALPDAIGALSSLTSLSLNYCAQIEHLPKSIGKLSKLVELSLGYAEALVDLPDSIGDLSNLAVLSADNSALKQLPKSIVKLKRLRSLHLPRGVEKMPASMGQLTALEELSLSPPALVAIASELPKLTKLTRLRLDFGDEEGGVELPEEIGQLTALRVLTAAFVKITRLPKSILALRNLVELDVAGNQLKELASVVAQLPKLKTLSFSGNPLGRNEKKLIDAMMRVAPSKRPAMLNVPIAKEAKNQPRATHLGQAVSINNSIMLMVGDASIAAKWQGTENATAEHSPDGSDWDKAFQAMHGGRSDRSCVSVKFDGGSLENLSIDVGGVIDVFQVAADRLVLVEGCYEEHERKHADFLAYVAEAPNKKAKKVGAVTITSGAIAFVPAPSSGKLITKNLAKLATAASKAFSTSDEQAVIAKLAKGSYEIWLENGVERSWGEAARAILVVKK